MCPIYSHFYVSPLCLTVSIVRCNGSFYLMKNLRVDNMTVVVVVVRMVAVVEGVGETEEIEGD